MKDPDFIDCAIAGAVLGLVAAMAGWAFYSWASAVFS